MTSDEAELDKYSMINFEETELRLGLPGGSSSSNDGVSSSSGLRISSICGNNSNNKRGFSETNGCGGVDLKLNLSSSSNNNGDLGSVSASCVVKENNKSISSSSSNTNVSPPPRDNDPAKPPSKAQVVGWPPVRSFRKNIVNNNNSNIQRSNSKKEPEKNTTTVITTATSGGATVNSASALVKVSVDGAPYLRKVDLKKYKSYKELSDALAKMFSSSFTVNCGSQSNETKLTDGSYYVPTYEDRDGDWMLVGDVPWEMFVESCKRLRMRKDSEAIGLAPRAVEKCKNKS